MAATQGGGMSGAMLGALGSIPIVGGIVNGLFNNYSIGQQNKANMELAKYQFDLNQQQAAQANQYNIDQWNRENAYNTPANQMSRFKDAGLNPALIYGQGDAGNAGPVPHAEMAQYQRPNVEAQHLDLQLPIMQTLSQYQDVKMKGAQIDNIRAQGDNIRQQTANMITDGLLKTAALTHNTFDNDLRAALKESIYKAAQAKNDITEQQLIGSKIGNELQTYNRDYMYPAKLQSLKLGNELLPLQILSQGFQNQVLGNDVWNLSNEGIPTNAPWGLKFIGNHFRSIIQSMSQSHTWGEFFHNLK